MTNLLKILFLLFFLQTSGDLMAFSNLAYPQSYQEDSLNQEVNNKKVLGSRDLLVLYQEAIKENRRDSITVFKNLTLLYAKLNQPVNSKIYAQKYINNTFDFGILTDSAYDVIRNTEQYKELSDKYVTKFNWVVFLFLYAALIGFSFTIFIYFLKKVNYATKFFISGFVAVHSLFVLEFVLYISNSRLKFPHTYLMASSVALWYGPFLYFYFKSLSGNFQFKIKDFLHFVPNILLIFYLLPLYTLDTPDKLQIILRIDDTYINYRYVVFTVKIFSLTIYAFLIGKLYYRNKRLENSSKGIDQVNIWKQNIYRIHVSYIISYGLYGLSASGLLGVSTSFLTYLMVAIMAIMIFYVAYMSYVQPNLFRENVKGSVIFETKYQKSGLTDSLSVELRDKMLHLLKEDKIFKQSGLNLDILSEKIGTTRHNTSQIINEHFNMNFFELINKFRIKEAIEILKEDRHSNLNIIDVAFEVGYNNKVTFNKAFKKETSITPSQFLALGDNKKVQVNFG